MEWLDDIRKAIFGEKGIFGSVSDFINTRWPPDMPPAQKAELEMALREFDALQEERRQNFTVTMEALANEAEAQFNQRIADLEGTASDLKSIPLLGAIMLFIRGSMRPVWCALTLFFDYKAFYGGIPLYTVEQASGVVHLTPQGTLLILINALVLGFIFGERTFRNIVPAIMPIVEFITSRRSSSTRDP